MAIVLYDLMGADDRYFSPFCWRARWALAHKGQNIDRHPVRFTEIKDIHDGVYETVPVIDDGEITVGGSFDIALYLEDAYPDAPTLFAGGPGLARFAEHWVQTAVHPRLVRLIVSDIHDHLTPEDQPYFASSREKRFGVPVDQVQASRDDELPDFRKALTPLRKTVEEFPFLGGDAPAFADYLIAGAFQWARVISPYQLFEADDPVAAWFGRVLDLYDGMGRQAKGYELAA